MIALWYSLLFICVGDDRRVAGFRQQLHTVVHETTSAAKVNETAFAERGGKPNPLVINNAKMPLVVYLERGFIFNKQVIEPGEAVTLHSSTWGPDHLAYSLVALVGDKNSMPTKLDSFLNFAGRSAAPTSFVVGLLASAAWGLSGSAPDLVNITAVSNVLAVPVAAIVPLIGGLIHLTGGAIAPADIAAGVLAAGGAQAVSKWLITEHPKAFMTRKSDIWAGQKYFVVTGGPDESTSVQDLRITEITQKESLEYPISNVKTCEGDRSNAEVAFAITKCGDSRAEGDWIKSPYHNDRAAYTHIDDGNFVIEWSEKHGHVWRMYYDSTWFGRGRPTLYESSVNTGEVPDKGWVAITGPDLLPTFRMNVDNATSA